MHIDETLLKYICKKHDIKMVLLFGSRADGSCSEDSDVDIGVLFEHDNYSYDQVLMDLIEFFKGYNIDVAVLNHSDPLLRFEIISNYKILYCEDKEVFINFYLNTIKLYNDTRKLREYENIYLQNFIGGKRSGVQQCHPPKIN